MREIKFRAWDEEENKMIEWNDTFFSDMSPVTRWSSYFSFIEMPLMQFTNFYDVNDKEIYIGDVVEHEDGSRYEVTINDFMQIPVLDNESGQGKLYEHYYKVTVIGNVYEMPDWEF